VLLSFYHVSSREDITSRGERLLTRGTTCFTKSPRHIHHVLPADSDLRPAHSARTQISFQDQ